MQKISIVKVDSPACFWGRAVETMEKYEELFKQMNLFYRDLVLEPDTPETSLFKEGQVCVVFWAELKCWCRAVVQFLINDSVLLRAACFLVDHGEQLIVAADRIRVLAQKFLELPFCMKKFKLAGIKPTTLRVTFVEEAAKLVPSRRWDSSATLYLHNLLRVSTQTEAVFVESESDCTSIELYLTVNKARVCVNDDLVLKKFAYRTGSTDCDGFPIMLSFRTLTQRNSPTSNWLLEEIPPPPGRHDSKSPAACGDDGLSALSPVCSQHEEDTRSEVTGQRDPDRLRGCSHAAAAASQRFLKFLHSDVIRSEEHPTARERREQNDRQSEEAAASDACAEQEILSGGLEEAVSMVDRALEEACSSAPLESESEERVCRTEHDLVCAEFLEWLNPGPLNPDSEPDEDPADVQPSSLDARKSWILVHSALAVETCSSLDDAPLTDALRWVLQKKKHTALSSTDCYSWPAVARGCNTLIISHNADQPVSYLYPLLTHILLGSIFTSCSSRPGPIAVLLCAGWKKVQQLFELLQESRVGPLLHPVTVLLGLDKEEAKAVRIPRNCLLVVTTPFSLVRLLSFHCFLFMRVSHLVLDEADQLFTVAPDQMAHILQHFQKVSSSDAPPSCSQQLVAVAKTWTGPMQDLLARHMPDPCIVISVPEEAALYGNVKQFIHVTQDSSKLSVLLALLELNPRDGLKTLVVTSSQQELEDVYKALRSRSLFCLKTDEECPQHLQQWREDVGPGTHLVLVTTDQCLKHLDISDATCVLHYSFPSSPGLFGRRILSMARHFPDLSQAHEESRGSSTRSVLLVTEKNAGHVNGLLRYLVRSGAPIPPELLAFAQDVHTSREDEKERRPLCSYLKSFGVCRNGSACPDRHRFVPRLDRTQLPASGVIEVVPLYIKTASVFLGRIVDTSEEDFQELSSEMACYYANRQPGASELLEGGLYAVQEDKLFHRVKILCVSEPADRLFFPVLVRFLDVGKEVEVRSHQILQLPERFHSLPAQAVEIVVCRVKPIDAETDWCPKVTRQISQKIRGLQHQAKVVLSLGNTIFVHPMIRVSKLPGLKTGIIEYSVQSEILKSRLGESNPLHVDLLRALCEDASSGSSSEAERASQPVEGKGPVKTFSYPEPALPDECLVQTPPAPELPSLCSVAELPPLCPVLELPPLSQLPPLSPAPELPPLCPAPELPPLSPVPELPPLSPAPELPPLSPAPELPPLSPACELPLLCPAPELPPLSPACELPPLCPVLELPPLSQLPPLSPAPELPPLCSVAELPPLSPALELPPLCPVPELPPLSPAPELPPLSPACELPLLCPAPELPPLCSVAELPPLSPACELPPLCPVLELPPLSQLPPLSPAPELPPGPSEAEQEATRTSDRKSAELTERKSRVCPSDWLSINIVTRHKEIPEAADQIRTRHIVSSAETDCDDSARSFHPLIRWYQTSDSVIVTVKLINPEEQSCHFHPDRVVYSGSVSGRSYRAELQLHQPIEVQRCSWEMRCSEPVLRLVKQQQEAWERLVSDKNIFVSYDLEHIEEDEDGSEDDFPLCGDGTQSSWNLSCDDDSDSDEDSD